MKLQSSETVQTACASHNKVKCIDDRRCYFDPDEMKCKVMENLLLTDDDGEMTLVCRHQRPQKRPCSRPLRGVTGFQCLTSWMFKPWLKWDAQVIPQKDWGPMKTGHSGTFRFFKLENFCVSPFGRLAGRTPQLSDYLGKDETHNVYHNTNLFSSFLRDVMSSDQPLGPILNRTAILFPVSYEGALNFGHTLHRVTSLLQIIKQAVKSTNRLPLVVVVLIGERIDLHRNPLASFLGLFSRHGWASIVSSLNLNSDDVHVLMKSFLDLGSVSEDEFRSSAVCFPQGFAWHNCIGKCDGTEPSQFSLWAPRTSATAKAGRYFRSEAARCLAVPLRDYANVDSPKIVISLRTLTRSWQDLALQYKWFRNNVKERYNGTISAVFETHRSPIAATFRAILEADVLIGSHGSGMGLMLLLPNGGVSYEFRIPYHADKNQAKLLSSYVFGAQVISAGLFHYAHTLPREAVRNIHQGSQVVNWYDIPKPILLFMLRQIKLGLGRGVQQGLAVEHEMHDLAKSIYVTHFTDAEASELSALIDYFANPPWYSKEKINMKCLRKALVQFRIRDKIEKRLLNESRLSYAPKYPILMREVFCSKSDTPPPSDAIWDQIGKRYLVISNLERLFLSESAEVNSSACLTETGATGGKTTADVIFLFNRSFVELPPWSFDESGCVRSENGNEYFTYFIFF